MKKEQYNAYSLNKTIAQGPRICIRCHRPMKLKEHPKKRIWICRCNEK